MHDMSLPQAIGILKEKYKEARASKYVSKPISWALYQTWQSQYEEAEKIKFQPYAKATEAFDNTIRLLPDKIWVE